MSEYHYKASMLLDAEIDAPFYSIIMLAIRRADTSNYAMLKACWPDVEADLVARYNAPGGVLPADAEETP